jgi:hypothetical protein
VLFFVAVTLGPYRSPGRRPLEADLAFAQQWLNGRALQRARNLLRDPQRRLVVPQALYALAKAAAVCSGDAVLPGVEAGSPVLAMFGALAMLDRATGGDLSDNVTWDRAGRLGQHLIANQHFNKPCRARGPATLGAAAPRPRAHAVGGPGADRPRPRRGRVGPGARRDVARTATGPDGQTGELLDSVVLLRRR